ncbi:hypothetical protein CALCODRAFT_493949 [Calocera cornea HHB12733]|uniref:Uncharacterized protein n=1 Tax=Calocera cornea HHB12733 TaxID=1353952 RepID=A0A165HDL8_9BASI|nr:hypothetical protein CALCODRAFT_493949 [Calocera cornea HHB12733]
MRSHISIQSSTSAPPTSTSTATTRPPALPPSPPVQTAAPLAPVVLAPELFVPAPAGVPDPARAVVTAPLPPAAAVPEPEPRVVVVPPTCPVPASPAVLLDSVPPVFVLPAPSAVLVVVVVVVAPPSVPVVVVVVVCVALYPAVELHAAHMPASCSELTLDSDSTHSTHVGLSREVDAQKQPASPGMHVASSWIPEASLEHSPGQTEPTSVTAGCANVVAVVAVVVAVAALAQLAAQAEAEMPAWSSTQAVQAE